MTIQAQTNHLAGATDSGFTFTETMVAVFLGATMLAALFASFAFGYGSVKLAREDLRATQILLEQTELLRLCPFNAIQSFTTNIVYDPTDKASGGGGMNYSITFTTNAPVFPASPPIYYANKMVLITATATWTNGAVLRTRSMQTYASKFGIQNYVYTPQ